MTLSITGIELAVIIIVPVGLILAGVAICLGLRNENAECNRAGRDPKWEDGSVEIKLK